VKDDDDNNNNNNPSIINTASSSLGSLELIPADNDNNNNNSNLYSAFLNTQRSLILFFKSQMVLGEKAVGSVPPN